MKTRLLKAELIWLAIAALAIVWLLWFVAHNAYSPAPEIITPVQPAPHPKPMIPRDIPVDNGVKG